MALTISRLDLGRFLIVGILEISCVPGSWAILAELNNVNRRIVGGIDADMLHSVVIGVKMLLACLTSDDVGLLKVFCLNAHCDVVVICFIVCLICVKCFYMMCVGPLLVTFGTMFYTWKKSNVPLIIFSQTDFFPKITSFI